MIKSLLNRILQARVLTDGRGTNLFTRYTILDTTLFGLLKSARRIYLHRFIRSDAERCLHDHPYDFVSVILWGGYYEEMQECIGWDGDKPVYWTETYWRGPGSILWRPAATAHRITFDHAGRKPISLVFVGPKVRTWGFYAINGWVAWTKAQGNPTCE